MMTVYGLVRTECSTLSSFVYALFNIVLISNSFISLYLFLESVKSASDADLELFEELPSKHSSKPTGPIAG